MIYKLPTLFIALLTFFLTFSSLSTKAVGLAWLMLVVAGTLVFIKNRRQLNLIIDSPWAKIWLITTTLALVVKIIAMYYWTDPWSERHGELRLFLGALTIYSLLGFVELSRNALCLFSYSLTFSSALGLICTVFYGRYAVPTHPIPWAGSMAMVSALLLALSLKSDFSITHRRVWFIGGIFAVMAVLSSQSRGSYGIVFWWLFVGVHHLMVRQINTATGIRALSKLFNLQKLKVLGILIFGTMLLSQTPVLERPAQSLVDAVNEIRISQQSTSAGANSSVGARLYMWQQSLLAIRESPWIGYGYDTRKKLLHEWAVAANSDEIKRLGHVHNEYLHQLIDHGTWGLMSQLLYLGGLIFLCWKLFKAKIFVAAFSLSGLTFIHMTSSLTNVNFSHNYYTASFSFFIGLTLWMTQIKFKNIIFTQNNFK